MEEKESKGMRWKSIALFFVISISLGGFILLQWKDIFFNPSYHVRLKPGLLVPNFTFPGLDGKMVRLNDYKGKVVFVNIWATWCEPCRDEMPSMERLYQKLKGDDFIILAVSINASGGETVTPFVKDFKLSFPVLLDSKGQSQRLFGTTGIPESFIIDKQGVLDQKTMGPRDWDSPEVILYFQDLIQRP
jgi:cytochrome c biogenesis protein CcmG/thiol:disulfide interchange protein DsbE